MDRQEFFPGHLTEVSGPAGGGKTEVVLAFLSQNPVLRVAWIEEGFSGCRVYPVGLAQRGVGLERILFVESKNAEESGWAVQQILKSGLFEVVVWVRNQPWPEKGSEVLLRRIQLASEKAGAFVFLLGERPTQGGAWPIAHQLWVRRNSSCGVESQIMKCRVWKRIGLRPVG